MVKSSSDDNNSQEIKSVDDITSQGSQERNDLAWSETSSSRIGENYQVSILPSPDTFHNASSSTYPEPQQIWDPAKAQNAHKFIENYISPSVKEFALELLHSKNYNVNGFMSALEVVTPWDGSDWNLAEHDNFRRLMLETKHDIAAVAKSMGKSVGNCLTVYYKIINVRETRSSRKRLDGTRPMGRDFELNYEPKLHSIPAKRKIQKKRNSSSHQKENNTPAPVGKPDSSDDTPSDPPSETAKAIDHLKEPCGEKKINSNQIINPKPKSNLKEKVRMSPRRSKRNSGDDTPSDLPTETDRGIHQQNNASGDNQITTRRTRNSKRNQLNTEKKIRMSPRRSKVDPVDYAPNNPPSESSKRDKRKNSKRRVIGAASPDTPRADNANCSDGAASNPLSEISKNGNQIKPCQTKQGIGSDDTPSNPPSESSKSDRVVETDESRQEIGTTAPDKSNTDSKYNLPSNALSGDKEQIESRQNMEIGTVSSDKTNKDSSNALCESSTMRLEQIETGQTRNSKAKSFGTDAIKTNSSDHVPDDEETDKEFNQPKSDSNGRPIFESRGDSVNNQVFPRLQVASIIKPALAPQECSLGSECDSVPRNENELPSFLNTSSEEQNSETANTDKDADAKSNPAFTLSSTRHDKSGDGSSLTHKAQTAQTTTITTISSMSESHQNPISKEEQNTSKHNAVNNQSKKTKTLNGKASLIDASKTRRRSTRNKASAHISVPSPTRSYPTRNKAPAHMSVPSPTRSYPTKNKASAHISAPSPTRSYPTKNKAPAHISAPSPTRSYPTKNKASTHISAPSLTRSSPRRGDTEGQKQSGGTEGSQTRSTRTSSRGFTSIGETAGSIVKNEPEPNPRRASLRRKVANLLNIKSGKNPMPVKRKARNDIQSASAKRQAAVTKPDLVGFDVEDSPLKRSARLTLNSTGRREVNVKISLAAINEKGSKQEPFTCMQDDNFDDKFEMLLEYKKKNGHCYVPKKFTENQPLSYWVFRQRALYKERAKGIKNSLSDDRLKRLEEVGFVFWAKNSKLQLELESQRRKPKDEAKWNRFISELIQYKAEFGNCLVPKCYPANQPLSTWVFGQRQQRRNFLNPERSSRITAEKIELLENIGFVWQAKSNQEWRKQDCERKQGLVEEAWQNHYKSLISYKEKHGHCRVPKTYGKNQALSSWVFRQRGSYKKMQEGKQHGMTTSRLKQLEDVS